MMQGGLSPDLDICWFEQVFADIKARYPDPPPLPVAARGGPHRRPERPDASAETLRRLRAAGLDSLPGGGAEVLVDRVRSEISPHKIPTATWLGVMREAHALGMRTTATMMFGSVDTPAERIEHLRRIRELQDETGGFTAFIPWTFAAANTALAGGPPAGHRRRLPASARRQPGLPRQRAQPAGLVGHPGPAHGPGRAGLRRQRHGLDHDRRERRARRGREPRGDRRGARAAHRRRRLRARAARHALPRGQALPERSSASTRPQTAGANRLSLRPQGNPLRQPLRPCRAAGHAQVRRKGFRPSAMAFRKEGTWKVQ